MLIKLESLRGVAACLVVIFHSRFNYGDTSIDFVNNSYLFVDFFFILSGYVMALAYSDKISNDLPFRSYLILRLGRIYPLHIFTLFSWLVYEVLLYLNGFDGTQQFSLESAYTFGSNLLLLQSMGLHNETTWNEPSWSISTELYTYILFFLLTIFFDKKKSLLIPILISISCYFFLTSLDRGNIDITYDFGFFRCIGGFYLGVFLFRLKKANKLELAVNNHINIFETISILLVITSIYLAERNIYFFIFPLLSFMLTLHVFSNEKNGLIGTFFGSNSLRKIGQWSYSIYLLHWLVLDIAGRFYEGVLGFDADAPLGMTSGLINTVLLIAIVMLSKFTFQYIEVTFRDISKRYAYNIKKEVNFGYEPNK